MAKRVSTGSVIAALAIGSMFIASGVAHAQLGDRLNEASEKARGLGEKAASKAEAALERAREIGSEAAVQAQDKVERAKEVGREAAHEAGEKVEAAETRVREVAAEVAERLRAARRAAFEDMHDTVDRPSDIPEPARAELKLHSRRIAELQRIRSLAQQKGDADAKRRSEELIAREHSRHDRRMVEVLRRPPPKAQRAPDSDEREEPAAESEREEDKGAEP